MLGLIFDRTARYGVTRDFATRAVTSWRTAYTGSEHCIIPAGTVLRLNDDVSEPFGKVHYELIRPPQGAAYIGWVFPEAVEMGFEDVSQLPDKWRKVVMLAGGGLNAFAENHAELEQLLIPEATRTHPKYGGYWFSLSLTAIGNEIEFMPARAVAVERGARLYVKERFECFGVRSDDVASRCVVPAEVVLAPRHAIENRRFVSGWEMTHKDFTWWRSEAPGESLAESEWLPTDRVCPSRFLADCAPEFTASVESDRDWDALLVPTELLGNEIVIV